MIEQLIQQLRNDWAIPHRQTKSDLSREDLELVCQFAAQGATYTRVAASLGVVPQPLQDLWSNVEWAEFFKDEEFGQWGLKLLTPEEAATESTRQIQSRPEDFQTGDIVIGEFLGDSEVLVVRCDSNLADFGQVIVALPIDHRKDWYMVSASLDKFLTNYSQKEGEKFWE